MAQMLLTRLDFPIGYGAMKTILVVSLAATAGCWEF